MIERGNRGWPGESEQAFGAIVVPIRAGQAIARFEDVPAGPFALSVVHDDFPEVPSEEEMREREDGVSGH